MVQVRLGFQGSDLVCGDDTQHLLGRQDRFLVGTDTWVTSRWESVREASDAVQAWLRQLPREVAEQIAWQNGDRLFPPP